MEGYIYIIKNTKNEKVYIGQTIKTAEKRFKDHIEASKNKMNDTKLYRAIRKYGAKNFYCEPIEKVPFEKLNERERYWVKYYNSYYNGYNSTLGGDGALLINYEKVAELWKEGLSVSEISKTMEIGRDSVSRILKSQGIATSEEIKNRSCDNKCFLSSDFVYAKWNDGMTPFEISKKFGGTVNTIKRFLHEYGITDKDIKDRSDRNQRSNSNKVILELWNNGLCISEIKRQVGGNWDTIRKQLVEEGITDSEINNRFREKANQNAIPVVQFDKNGNKIAIYKSAKKAAEAVGGSSGSPILNCCKHKPRYKTAYGYMWEFYDKKDELGAEEANGNKHRLPNSQN